MIHTPTALQWREPLDAQSEQAVQAALEAFANTALATELSGAEIEMSLAWAAVEAGLLDRVARAADMLARSELGESSS